MEDKWKVFIKGDNDRGNEAIKLLTDLGANNPNNYYGKNSNGYYYINSNGEIAYAVSERHLLHDFYTEIELPERKKWKDGDLLVRSHEGKKEYIVYSDEKTNFDDEILSYVYVYDKGYDTMVIGDTIGFKEASVNDINDFQELLHTHGKEWSFKYKVLVDWIWKPENNEEYWYINEAGEICHTLFNGFLMPDLKRVSVGNCFKTKDDAITVRAKIAKILLNKYLFFN